MEKVKKIKLELDKLGISKLTTLNIIKGGGPGDDDGTISVSGGSTRKCMES